MTPFRHYAKFTLNGPQAKFNLTMANESWLCMGRGSGKTQGCTAPYALHKVETMPGSCGALIAQSFADAETKILKPLFAGFAMMGHEYGVHFTYGKEPPADWKKCLIPIIDYKHVIAFPNGTTIQIISLHQKGSANSNSFQWVIGPEAKYFDENQLRSEVFPTLRGLGEQFGNSAWYGSKMFETDKQSPNIHWILEKRKLHDEALVQTVIFYQLEVNKIRTKLPKAGDAAKAKLKTKLRKFNYLLNELRRELVYFGEGSAYDNVMNLTPGYIANMKRSLTEYEFDVAIANMDPTRAENGFYPERKKSHLYLSENDEDLDRPLAIAMDYQASISPLVWCQLNDKVYPGARTLNFLGSMYVKHPLGYKHVIDDFCEKYKDRPCKEVHFFYDHTANDDQNGRKKKWEEICQYFRDNGWKINAIYMGQAPYHQKKYDRINYYLRNENPYLEHLIRIHMEGCSTMIMSMDLAETLETIEHGTKKNKLKEKDKSYPQEYATHFSDVFDMLIWAILELKLLPSHSVSSGRSSVRFSSSR